jgi:hypothetical protein
MQFRSIWRWHFLWFRLTDSEFRHLLKSLWKSKHFLKKLLVTLQISTSCVEHNLRIASKFINSHSLWPKQFQSHTNELANYS